MKNTMAKTRPANDPYEVWSNGLWTWRVLKKWQVDDAILNLKDSRIISVCGNNTISPTDLVGNSSTCAVVPTKQFKVGESIITSNAILVMNGLKGKQSSPKFPFHKDTVFGFIFPITITQLNKNQYIPLFSEGSTTFVVPSMSWDFEAAGLTKPTSFILDYTTLTEILSLFSSTRATDMITPPTRVLVTDLTLYRSTSLGSNHPIPLREYEVKIVDKPYARWFCHVTSPMCPEGEMGDVYVKDIKSVAIKREVI